MFGDAGVERIFRKLLITFDQAKLRLRHDKVKKTHCGAHGTVAFINDDIIVSFRFPLNGAAMTASLFPTAFSVAAFTHRVSVSALTEEHFLGLFIVRKVHAFFRTDNQPLLHCWPGQ